MPSDTLIGSLFAAATILILAGAFFPRITKITVLGAEMDMDPDTLTTAALKVAKRSLTTTPAAGTPGATTEPATAAPPIPGTPVTPPQTDEKVDTEGGEDFAGPQGPIVVETPAPSPEARLASEQLYQSARNAAATMLAARTAQQILADPDDFGRGFGLSHAELEYVRSNDELPDSVWTRVADKALGEAEAGMET